MQKRYLGQTMTGVDEYFEMAPDGKTFTIHSEQDPTAFVDQQKRQVLDSNNGWTPQREFKKLGSLTPFMIQVLNKQYGCNILARENDKLLRRILKDPDHKHLRGF